MPQAADPDFVNAVVRGDVPGAMPTCITVFCDVCGIEHTGDYLVREADDSPTRLGYARAHMREQGWRCDEHGDLCPACATPPRDFPPYDMAVIRSVGAMCTWEGEHWRWDGRDWQRAG